MRKPKFEQTVWVVCWPKGTTEKWEDEGKGAPKDYMPITVETNLDFMYYSEKEKRDIYGFPIAIFSEKAEAEAWREADMSDGWDILRARLTIL